MPVELPTGAQELAMLRYLAKVFAAEHGLARSTVLTASSGIESDFEPGSGRVTGRIKKGNAERWTVVGALWISVAYAAILGSSAECWASPARPVQGLAAVDSLVSAEFAKDSTGSITVGVISGSQLVWTRSVGFADMKTRRLADRNTVYRIGSITKPFTAVMLMQLVAAEKLRLSDPVERYLPEVKKIASRPQGAQPFTFMQLATMTAGLAREPDEAGPFWTGPASDWEKQLLLALPHTRYLSPPGTAYSYSNIGYATLGAALARVARQSYVEWERSRVLEPLGMRRTRFELDSTIEADLAVGYQVQGDGALDDQTSSQEVRNGRGYKVPNGAIFTTVDDLARFVSFELGCGPDSVLPRPILADAFDGLVATDASLETGYGLGFMAMRRGDYAFVGHNGGVAGYFAAMYYDRNTQLGVVLFRNVNGGKQDPDRLAVDILSLLASTKTAEIQVDTDRRVEAQAASPGSEAAIRRLIGELRLGKPSWELMNFTLDREARRQVAEEQSQLAKLGALQSLTFTRVARSGANIFTSTFEHGARECRIWMNLDGSVDSFFIREVPQPPK